MPRSPKLQRLTALAVPALLAANAMVLALGLSVMDDAEPASAGGTETVTYLKAADGTLRLVDPSTPEGSRAIADANQRGEDVVTVSDGNDPAGLMQQGKQPTTTLVPGPTAPVDDLLDQTESTVVDTLDQLGDAVDGLVEDVTGIIDDNAGTNLGDTLNPIVDQTTDTVSTVVADTRRTVTTVVDTATTPPAPAPVPEPAAPLEPVAEVVPAEAPILDGPLGL